MSKLTVIAMLSLTALAGCPKKSEKDKTEAQPKPTDTTAVKDPAKDPVKDPAKDPVKEPGKDELPAECTSYKEMADKLASCEALGAQRDVLKGEFDKSWTAWTALKPDERGKLAETCKTAADALKTAAGATCKW